MNAIATKSLRIAFTVHGRPQQRGSKRAVLIPKRGGGFVEKNGRPIVAAKDMNEKSQEWMGQVRDSAAAAFSGELIQGAVRLTCWFYFKRLKGHFSQAKATTGRLLASAPAHHTGTPDLDKLIRSIGDSLTGVILQDDKQICQLGNETGKYWTTSGECAEILIEVLE